MSIRWPATELDDTSFPSWRDAIAQFDDGASPDHAPRSYPGYPRIALPRSKRRLFAGASLDRALTTRRSARTLGRAQPSAADLGRICELAHGVTGEGGRGPVPSAGGLQALELYVCALTPGWLARGAYHYDRGEHTLAHVCDADALGALPGAITIDGGALLWVLVGDGARVDAKYGARGLRFLLLEAGHLMQNLCLVCADVGLTTVPLGGFSERALATQLQLPPTDEVLYVGACG